MFAEEMMQDKVLTSDFIEYLFNVIDLLGHALNFKYGNITEEELVALVERQFENELFLMLEEKHKFLTSRIGWLFRGRLWQEKRR